MLKFISCPVNLDSVIHIKFKYNIEEKKLIILLKTEVELKLYQRKKKFFFTYALKLQTYNLFKSFYSTIICKF